MKRLVRAVEAIPLHLTLPIVRLDDALGESWALPYQACQTFQVHTPFDVHSDCAEPWQGFRQILRQVVFANGRPGAHHVELGRFVIRSIKNGVELNEDTWNSVVKERTHLTQAMILSTDHKKIKECPFADCRGSLQSNGIEW